jgi:hypothetical protein
MSDLIEDLGDGSWLIKPSGEIKKCSRSTAYRHARKAEKRMQELEEDQANEHDVQDISESDDDAIHENDRPISTDTPTITIKSEATDEIEVETQPIFDLPSLDDLRGDDSADSGDTFQGEGDSVESFADRDEGFIKAIKGAEIIEDGEGNKKVRLADILIGDNPIIASLLGGIDHSLYAWAENKNGMILWNKESRAVQRRVFVKTLSIVAPKTSIELDPIWVIIGMTGWLYGVPLLRIASKTRKEKKAIAKAQPSKYEDQKVVVFDE